MVNDVFDEVEVQMRADRARSFFARSWPWMLGALVLVLAAVAGVFAWRSWQASRAEQASIAYQTAMTARGGTEALGQPPQDPRRADAAFAQAAEGGTPGYRALALMQRAALALDRHDTATAVRFLDEAAGVAPEPVLADAAALQAAYALMDTAPLAEIERRLAPISAEDRPYRPLAREAHAVALAMAGRTADARREFVVLSLLEGSPETLRTRAQANIQVLDGGGASALRAIAQAARGVPDEAVAAYRQQQAQAQALAQAQAQAAQQAQAGGAGAATGGPPSGPPESSPGPAQ